MREFIGLVWPFILVHTLVQIALGVALGDMAPALCMSVVLPLVLAFAGAVSWAVVEVWYAVFPYKSEWEV